MTAKSTPEIIFLILGGFLIIISILLEFSGLDHANFFAEAIVSIALVPLTVVILGFVWRRLGGEPILTTLVRVQQSIHLLNDSRITGLQRIFHVTGEFGGEATWMAQLMSVQKRVDLLGNNLHSWTGGENFKEQILTLVKRGVQFRVLIMDEGNPEYTTFLETGKLTGSEIQTAQAQADLASARVQFNQISKEAAALSSKHPDGKFELRTVKKGRIACQICRTDDAMVVINYLFSQRPVTSPLITIQGRDSKLFIQYTHEFEKLWDLNPN